MNRKTNSSFEDKLMNLESYYELNFFFHPFAYFLSFDGVEEEEI